MEQNPKPMQELILREALEVVMRRNALRGKAENSFPMIADLWNTYWSTKGVKGLNSVDVAMLMVLLKVARIARNPGDLDSYVDIAGYAACAAQCAQNEGFVKEAQ